MKNLIFFLVLLFGIAGCETVSHDGIIDGEGRNWQDHEAKEDHE